MPAYDLNLRDLSPAGLVYVPILAEIVACSDQPTYALADVLHAQAWLLQCLERRLTDYALAEGAFPILLTTLGGVGDLAQQLSELRAQVLLIERPGILSGRVTIATEVESANADLMSDEAEALLMGGTHAAEG